MDDIEKKVIEHGIEIQNLKDNQRDSEKRTTDQQRESEQRVMQTIQGVQKSMREEMEKIDVRAEARDKANQERLSNFEKKLDEAVDKLRRAVPPWVGIVIGALIAIGGWMHGR